MRKRLRRGLIVFALGALGVVLYDRAVKIRWVGGTELTVEFLVSDAETGEPIEGAEVWVHSELRRYRLEDKENFRVHTNQPGVASAVLPHNTCIGSQSGLRFTDTRVVYLPEWMIVGIRAEGYQQVEPFALSKRVSSRDIEQVGPQKDRLVVPIVLRKGKK